MRRQPRRPMSRRPNPWVLTALILAAALFALTGLSGCAQEKNADAATTQLAEVPRNVRVLTVTPADLEEYMTISGPAKALRGVSIGAEEGGQVDAIPKDKGSEVKAGEVLILLDRRLLKVQMDAATADRDLRAYNEDRTRQLYEANSVSRIEMLQAETELKVAEAAVRSATLRYERAAIEAPFNGIVADRFVELGQLVAPGMPVARIVDPYVLKLAGTVTEREVGYLTKGTPAQASFDGVNEALPAWVHWVGFEADPLTGKFQVEVRIENPDLRLRPGIIGRARILKAVHENVITVPRDAIVLRADGPVVYVAASNHAQQRPVTLGSDQGLMVVVESGLASGDKLIVRGQRDIHDGSAILIQEEATAEDGTTPADPRVVTQGETVSDVWRKPPAHGGDGR
jgi:membrane fusion protein (multidrug efflux system)